jgi:hypothetical protein
MDEEGGLDTFTVLVDISSMKKRFDIHAFKRLAFMLKQGFRGRLYKLYAFPCGKIEKLALAAIKPFLGKGTVKKIVLLGSKDVGHLISTFAPDALPIDFKPPPQGGLKILKSIVKVCVAIVVVKSVSKVFIR